MGADIMTAENVNHVQGVQVSCSPKTKESEMKSHESEIHVFICFLQHTLKIIKRS